MKKITILFVALLAIQFAKAQTSITLSMNPRPIANINDWSGRRDVLTLIAIPQAQGGARNVKINTTIKTADGTSVAVTDMLRAPVRTLIQGGSTVFYAADVVNMQALVFESSYQNKINRTGKLPVGNYQIIVRLDSTEFPIAVSNTQTKTFFLSATQLPVLVAPANEAVLPSATAQTAITFRWTSLVPSPTEAVRYHVQVFEVLADQTAMQAMRSNQPLLDKEVLNSTQFIWQPQLSFADGKDKKFVWTIQSFDFKNELITGEVANGEGRSEAKVFTVSATSSNRLGKRNNGL
jgi:hypothetical protein